MSGKLNICLEEIQKKVDKLSAHEKIKRDLEDVIKKNQDEIED